MVHVTIEGLEGPGLEGTVEPGEVEQAPPFGAGIRTDFIAGMARDNGGFTIIIDVRRVLSLDDIRQLSLAQQAS